MNFTRLRVFRPRSSKQHVVNFIIFAFEWFCFICLKIKISMFCIFFEHLVWKEDQCNEANCTVRRISISERYENLKHCWGVEDEIWIRVEASVNWVSIALSASFILLSALIGVVRSLYLSINSRELFNVKTNLLWIALLYPVIIHPSPFCPSHSLQNETWIYQIFRFSSVQLHHWKRKWWARFASSNTLNLKVWFQAEKSSQE